MPSSNAGSINDDVPNAGLASQKTDLMTIVRVATRLFRAMTRAEAPGRMRSPLTWPKLVFIVLPALIVAVDAFVLIRERRQPESEKAIRLVRESNSRKENFTVQQYLYSTVYYRRDQGEAINIEGWRASSPANPDEPIPVEFSYEDSGGNHTAIWEASLKDGTVGAKNEAALDLSWH